MSILKSSYYSYVSKMQDAKERMKRDKEIIKIVSKMINKKGLSLGEQNRLQELLNKINDSKN